MGKNRGKHRNSWQPMRWPACTNGPSIFVFFGEGGGMLDFFGSQCVSIKFPLGFQHVPNSTSHYLISFALSFTLMTYISSWKERDCNMYILGLFKAWLIFFWQPNQWCPSQNQIKKKKLWGFTQLINMSHSIPYPLQLIKDQPHAQ
jgi:hypothetical protein